MYWFYWPNLNPIVKIPLTYRLCWANQFILIFFLQYLYRHNQSNKHSDKQIVLASEIKFFTFCLRRFISIYSAVHWKFEKKTTTNYSKRFRMKTGTKFQIEKQNLKFSFLFISIFLLCGSNVFANGLCIWMNHNYNWLVASRIDEIGTIFIIKMILFYFPTNWCKLVYIYASWKLYSMMCEHHICPRLENIGKLEWSRRF